MNGKTGLILEGGALRGVFTAGVLDYLLEKKVEFPYVIGVSAGSGNASSFTSKQPGRMKKVLMQNTIPLPSGERVSSGGISLENPL